MSRFGLPFFLSDNLTTEMIYSKGVSALEVGKYRAAFKHFSQAAEDGHLSASYNLALLIAMGHVSPYDIDLSIRHYQRAARAGHPNAKFALRVLDSVEGGAFSYESSFLQPLVEAHMEVFVSRPGELSPYMILFATQLFKRFCSNVSIQDAFIAAELDAASQSEWPAMRNFIKRTGIPSHFYRHGMARLQENRAADLITDRLIELSLAMLQTESSQEMTAFVRSTIVGYVIENSRHAEGAKPLLGMKDFWA